MKGINNVIIVSQAIVEISASRGGPASPIASGHVPSTQVLIEGRLRHVEGQHEATHLGHGVGVRFERRVLKVLQHDLVHHLMEEKKEMQLSQPVLLLEIERTNLPVPSILPISNKTILLHLPVLHAAGIHHQLPVLLVCVDMVEGEERVRPPLGRQHLPTSSLHHAELGLRARVIGSLLIGGFVVMVVSTCHIPHCFQYFTWVFDLHRKQSMHLLMRQPLRGAEIRSANEVIHQEFLEVEAERLLDEDEIVLSDAKRVVV